MPGPQGTGLGFGAALSPPATPQGSPAVTSAQPLCSPQPPNPAHLASVREGLCSSGRRDRARVWGPAPCPLALGQPREALDHGVTGFAGWSRAHAAAVRGSSPQSCTNHPPGARRETDPKGPRTADSLDTPRSRIPPPFPPSPEGTPHWNFQIHSLVSDLHERESERLRWSLASFMVLLRVTPLLERGSS